MLFERKNLRLIFIVYCIIEGISVFYNNIVSLIFVIPNLSASIPIAISIIAQKLFAIVLAVDFALILYLLVKNIEETSNKRMLLILGIVYVITTSINNLIVSIFSLDFSHLFDGMTAIIIVIAIVLVHLLVEGYRFILYYILAALEGYWLVSSLIHSISFVINTMVHFDFGGLINGLLSYSFGIGKNLILIILYVTMAVVAMKKFVKEK